MSLTDRLAQERRARLAAERMLELKQSELFAANRKLDKHARKLSSEITETRAEVESVRDENQRVKSELGAANQKIEIVESQLWRALQTIHDGFAMFNADGSLEVANPAWLAMFDGLDTIRPGASIGHVYDMMVEEGIVDLQGEAPDRWLQRMKDRSLADSPPVETIRLWSGQFLKMEDRRTPDGGLVSLLVDITDLMRMWSAVEELPDGFVMYDGDDNLLMCNARYRDIYSASAPAMVPGTSFEDILRYGLEHGEYADAKGREDAWLQDRLLHHRSPNSELEQQLADGRWIRVFERETRDGGRAGLRIDITQMKQTQRALDDARQRAETANRAKSAFLANMSHEIRTPMNGVVGMADLLGDTALDDDQALYVETIRNSGEALLTIINDVLDYSKIEADKLTLAHAPFELDRAVEEVAMLLRPSAVDKGVALTVNLPPDLPTEVLGDAGRLRQVLTNLVGNAIKFTPQGEVTIDLRGQITDGTALSLTLAITDTGIGIPPDKVDHIFGEFNQVEDDRNRAFEGTGLGLAITKRLVTMMGGDLTVRSAVDQGSCFTVAVQLDLVHPVPASPEPPPTLSDKMRQILLLGADEAVQDTLIPQMERLGQYVVAQDTATGLAVLDFDAVILGPDMDVAQTGKELRAQKFHGPILSLADQADDPDGMPFCGVLRLPVSQRALLQVFSDRAACCARSTACPAKQLAALVMPPKPEPQPLDVLVAEDNRTNQLVFSKMAAGFDVTLRFANNGHEAVAAVAEKRPDIVFMDISMPGMDGKEATRTIRKAEVGPHLPIVALTAHAMTGDREAILEAGLDDYLSKPLRKANISDVLGRYFPDRFKLPVAESA